MENLESHGIWFCVFQAWKVIGFNFRLSKVMEFANKIRKKGSVFLCFLCLLFVLSLVSCVLIGEPITWAQSPSSLLSYLLHFCRTFALACSPWLRRCFQDSLLQTLGLPAGHHAKLASLNLTDEGVLISLNNVDVGYMTRNAIKNSLQTRRQVHCKFSLSRHERGTSCRPKATGQEPYQVCPW
jgi:hypothetical protein